MASPEAIETAWRARRRARLFWFAFGTVAFFAAFAISAQVAELSPAALIAGAPRMGAYFGQLIPDLRWPVLFAGAETPGSLAYWFYRLDIWLRLLLETSQMAALATLLGAGLALPLSFFASANLVSPRLAFTTRRLFDCLRSIPDIVYALVLVWAFGVGPLAGILAIMLHTLGALGKLLADVVENADLRAREALIAAGGSWLQATRFAVLPQVLPNFLSYALLRFEINVRGATVIGVVGAGGIGQELYAVISFNYYQEISAIVVLIILTVSVIDLASEWLRSRAMSLQ